MKTGFQKPGVKMGGFWPKKMGELESLLLEKRSIMDCKLREVEKGEE